MEKEGLPLLKDYIILNKFGLSVLGVWPLRDDAPKWRVSLQHVHVGMIYLLLFGLLVPQILDLYVFRGNIQANAENLCTSLTTFTVLAKLTNLVTMRHALKVMEDEIRGERLTSSLRFKVAVREMEKNWNRTMRLDVPKIHRDILFRTANVSRIFTTRYCVTMYVTASMYFILPLITDRDSSPQRPRKYPFCAWYYYDQTSDVVYVMFYLSQVVIGLSCGTGNFSMDSLFLVMVHHLCAQLQILQREFRMLGTSAVHSNLIEPPRSRDERINDCKVLQKTKDLIRDHERHIQNARNLKAVFDLASLQQLFVSSVIICVIGFKLIVSFDASGFEVTIYLTYMHLVIFQIYLYCSPGDDLLNESLRIARAVYESPWMDLPFSVTQCLLVTVMRSQRPLSITAGNFFVMSMPNFTKILKTSLSYLSVLRAMYDDSYSNRKS